MMYKVVKMFTDLQDKNYRYDVGDTFPHTGIEVSEKRIIELASNKNRQGVPLIEAVEELEKPKRKKAVKSNEHHGNLS